jgi:hypothetical protein
MTSIVADKVYIRQSNIEIYWSSNGTTSWNMLNWPVTLNSSLTVFFTTNLTLSNNNQYFILNSDYITLNGNSKQFMVKNVSSWPGLFQNGTSITNGHSYIMIQNFNMLSDGSQLAINGGYLCQKDSFRGSSGTIRNCSSSGPISMPGCGGLFGSNSFNASSAMITGCTNNGIITGVRCGGICGENAFENAIQGTVYNCTNNGYVTSTQCGGILGYGINAKNVAISNCVNTGSITGSDSGGILSTFECVDLMVQNCYCTGIVVAGIMHEQPVSAYITNCYTLHGNICNVYANPSLISYCYSTVWNTARAISTLYIEGNEWVYDKTNGITDTSKPFKLYSMNTTYDRVQVYVPPSLFFYHPTFASNTASHDSFFALKRTMAVAKTEQNRLPKVGVMSSSQRTGLQVSSFANRRTQFQKQNVNDVKCALAKVRGGGCVSPKKKGAII